jgi:methyl-accepting chemotaxis protein
MFRRFATRMRIGRRLAIMVALPLSAVAGLGAAMIIDKATDARAMRRLDALVDFSLEVSNLVHALQTERGMSAVFLSSRGTQFAGELAAQRRETDARRAAVVQNLAGLSLDAHPETVRGAITAGMQALAGLEARRADISAQRIAAPESFAFFTGLIGHLVSIPREAAKSSFDPAVTSALLAYHSFMSAKERAGQERGSGAVGFAAGQFTPEQHRRYLTVLAEQRAFLDAFSAYATPAQRDLMATTLSGPVVQEVERMRAIAVEAGPGASLAGVTGAAWFKATTDRIDLMKTVEASLANDLRGLALSRRDAALAGLMAKAVIVGAIVALALAACTWITRSITGPVTRMTGAMTDLAAGKLETEIPALDSRDEIGAMAKAVQVFKENAIAVRRMEEEARAAAIAAEAEKKAAMRRMADDFQAAVGGVVNGVSAAATEMQGSAQALSATAEETSRRATAVGAATEQASANVQTVAASAEELAASIAEISRQVATSAQIAQKAVDQATATNARIESLSEAAGQIGDVVRLIGEIAGKTNLLALNATIEAARAGEAGKGFAVVAAEVKTLATQTARATEEIGAKVAEMQGATAQSVESIRSIGQVIGEISTIATSIASAVEEQGAATAEIARNVQEAARGTQEVSANVTGVTQASAETGRAAGQMLAAATELSQQAETLRREVDQFLAGVRAA